MRNKYEYFSSPSPPLAKRKHTKLKIKTNLVVVVVVLLTTSSPSKSRLSPKKKITNIMPQMLK